MTQPALDSLLVVFAFLAKRHGPGPEDIGGHRDFSATACPGDNNYRQLPGSRAAVQDLLRTGNATLGAVTLAARADSVGVVTVEWMFTADYGIQEFRIERSAESHTEILYRGHAAEDGRIVDVGVTGQEPIAYVLTALGNRGREQILGTFDLTLQTPGDFVLAQNFPNPAAGSTTIRYYLTQPGLVSLAVFDAAGRRVATLDEAFREEGLWHVLDLNTSSMPSGVYFCRVVLDGFAGVVHETANQLVVAH